MVSTKIDITNDIENINDILNRDDIDDQNVYKKIKGFDIFYNNDESKYIEIMKVEDNEYNIMYDIILYSINNNSNILKEVINLDEDQIKKKYIILYEIILKRIKHKYSYKINKYNNCNIKIKIYPLDKNIVKININTV